jgi:anhydro-N-acetylmuramic acid kinase
VIAFDTGPASAMIDDLVRQRRGVPFDDGGRIAAAGRVDAVMLKRFAAHPYFDRPPPKSLDRNDFVAMIEGVERLSDEDGAATLTAFTIFATVAALRHVPSVPLRWLVAGGGRHNTHIMMRLADELRVPVEPVEAVGWDGDFIEAQCFGYLAARAVRGLPLSLPTTTGVPAPLTGGEISEP